MKATKMLHDAGQSIWLDNISRGLLETGRLRHYIEELSVTGLTSNLAIFQRAMSGSAAYGDAIREKQKERKSNEAIFFELALEEITHAADLFRSIHDRTGGVDGLVSLEISPLRAHDTGRTVVAARDLFSRARRPNLLIEIPGTREGLPAIEEAIFSGVPVNVTLLFSREQYLAAANAFLRGIERRIDAGLRVDVGSVASMSVGPWDEAVKGKVPEALENRLGIAVAKRTYKACREFLSSPRWQRAFNAGARPQRILWSSTETKDPRTSDIHYVKWLTAPLTVNAMPEDTLKALANRSERGPLLPADGGDCEGVLDDFVKAGIDIDTLAAKLQDDGLRSFVRSWHQLMAGIESNNAARKTMVNGD